MHLRATCFEPPRHGLDDHAAADGSHGRGRPQEERVARAGHHGRLRPNLDQARRAAFHVAALKRIEHGGGFRRARVKLHFRSAFQRQLFARQQPQRAEIPLLRREVARDGQRIAATDLAVVPLSDVERRALAGHDGVAGLAIDLDPPDSPGEVARQEDHFVSGVRRSGKGDAGHDGAIAGDGESALQRQAKHAVGPSRLDGSHQGPKAIPKTDRILRR